MDPKNGEELQTETSEVNHECVFVGKHESVMKPVGSRPQPPKWELARSVALTILGGERGSYRPSAHFQRKVGQRNFDVFDCEYAIRNGVCIETGEYCDEHKNYKYMFRADIDGVSFDAVFALSAEHDLIKAPLMILITGCWKTKSGRRAKRY